MKFKSSNLFFVFTNFVKKNKEEVIFLILILFIGGFLRLYKIDQYMTFLGDEGRDVLVVRRLLTKGDLIFVGPGTSIGNIYLGPFYYYMMAPALFFANYSPVGPAVQIALLGVATIFMVWYIGRKWWGEFAGLSAAFLYSISPVVITYSRSSWNPNIMPFFTLIMVYSVWKMWYEKKWKWFLLSGFSFAIMLQSHYLGLIMLPFIGLFWFLSIKEINLKKSWTPIKYSLSSVLIFLLMALPLIIFDSKYHWRNFKALIAIFHTRDISVSTNLSSFLSKFVEIFKLIVTRLLSGTNITFGIVFVIIVLVGLFWYIIFKREFFDKKKYSTYIILASWIVFSILGLSFYRQVIYDHYLGFVFSAPFLLIGALIQEIKSSSEKLGLWMAIIVIVLFSIPGILFSPLREKPNRQLDRTIEVSSKILSEAGSSPFNLAVIADQNYEGAYQYYLELWKAPLVIIEPQLADKTITNQLFVVCEYSDLQKCQPTSNPKAEVANFGWSKVVDKWNVDGVEVYKLIHNYPGK